MTTKTKYKQTRKSISVSGEVYLALKTHCGAEGLSLSGYIEALVREQLSLPARDLSLERSPVLMQEAQEAKKAAKAAKSAPEAIEPAPEPPPEIMGTYVEPIPSGGEEEIPEPPVQETTTATMGGPVQPIPTPVEVFVLEPGEMEGSLSEEPTVLSGEPAPEPELAPSVVMDLPQAPELSPIDPEPVPEPPPAPAPEPVEEPVEDEPGSVEDEPEPDKPETDEFEDDADTVREPVPPADEPEEAPDEPEEPEDTRPERAIRADRPSMDFMTKGERERAERAKLIAQRAAQQAEKERERRLAEANARPKGNVFQF